MTRADAIAALTGTAATPTGAGAPAGPRLVTIAPVEAGGDVLVTVTGHVTVAWRDSDHPERGVLTRVLAPGESALVDAAQARRLDVLGVTTATGPAAEVLTAERLAGMSVADAEAWATAHPDGLDTVLALEAEGRARVTLIRALERVRDDNTAADTAGA